MFSIVALLSVLVFREAVCVSNVGKTFFQTFHYNHPDVEPGVVHLFVLSTSADFCSITITVDAPPPTNYIVNVTSKAAVVYKVNANSTRGVKLQAPCDFVVYGQNFASQSADGWMGIPLEALDREYMVLSVEPWLVDPTQLSIVATEDNTVCTSFFSNGSQIVSKLNALDVHYMTSNLDFTGTKVTCNAKVSVFSGQRCSTVPQGCIACDHTVEQIPPKATLGRNHVLAPLLHSCAKKPTCCKDPKFCEKCIEIFRVLALEDNTSISRSSSVSSEAFTLNSGQSRYLLTAQNEFSSLISDKPVLVGHYFNGQGYEGKNEDPAFAIVPATETYASSYQAATCFPQFQQHFVTLVISAGSSNAMRLNGAPFLNAQGSKVHGQQLEVFRHEFDCSKAITKPMSFKIEHTKGEPFGLFAYGFSEWISYGYPGGMQLNPISKSICPAASMNISEDNVTVTVCNLTETVLTQPPLVHSEAADECCEGNSTLSYADQLISNTTCQKTVNRIWTSTDHCGRAIHVDQTIVITMDPNITYHAPNATVHVKKCALAKNISITGQPVAEGPCNATLNMTYEDITDNYTTHVHRIWTVTAECSNTTAHFKQLITCGTTKSPCKRGKRADPQKFCCCAWFTQKHRRRHRHSHHHGPCQQESRDESSDESDTSRDTSRDTSKASDEN